GYGQFGHAAIKPVIAGLPRPDPVEKRHLAYGFRQRVAYRPEYLPNAVHDMNGQLLAVETGGVLFLAVMQLADRLHPDARLLQAMPPTGGPPRIGNGVVPAAVLVHVAAGGDAGARGHAYGRRRISSAEARPPFGQCIQIRGFYDRMPRTAHDVGIVF